MYVCVCCCVDAVVHGLSAGGVGYLAVLHAQLFDQQPGLAFIPLFVVCAVAHFIIRGRSAQASKTETEAARAGQVHPLLPRDANAKAGSDEDVRGRGAAAAAAVNVTVRHPTIASLNDHEEEEEDGHPYHHEGDDDHLDSSSDYSSPEEDDFDQDIGRDGELEDPYIFLLDVQPGFVNEDDGDLYHNQVDSDNTSQSMFGGQHSPPRSSGPEVWASRTAPQHDGNARYPDLPSDGVWQSSSGHSSDYNTLSDMDLHDSESESIRLGLGLGLGSKDM